MTDVSAIVRAVRSGREITRTEALELADALAVATERVEGRAASDADAERTIAGLKRERDRWAMAALALIERSEG